MKSVFGLLVTISGGVLVLLSLFVIGTVTRPGGIYGSWSLFLISLLLPLFGAGLVWLGLRLQRT